jgi:hypothetical protein
MGTVLWVVGFALMLLSFAFLAAPSEKREQPRISVERRRPMEGQRPGPDAPQQDAPG